jgi:tetratricopeptide (TPR) repeat protein
MRTTSLFLTLGVVLWGTSVLVPAACMQQQRGLGVSTPPTAVATVHYYALIIGNNGYTALPKLKTAEADARAVEKLLRESYGFQTKLLVNATRAQTVSALSAYRRELSSDASLLIYYAGHGYNDKDADKAYWLPVDAERDDVSNWIIADEITTGIRVIPAKHVLVISDSCYSGTLSRGLSDMLPRPAEREQFLQRMAAGHSRTLMASGGDEPVVDSGGSGHSIFADALLHGLREIDKVQFTAGELFRSYVEESVAGRAQQTPEYNPLRNSGHESGDFVFIKIKNVEVAVTPPPSPVDQSVFELEYWDAIKASSNPEEYQDYLKQYPNGRFADIARRRAAGSNGMVVPLPAVSSTPEPSANVNFGAASDAAHAFTLLKEGHSADAAREAKQIAAVNPNNSEAWKVAGFAEFNLNQFADASNDLQKSVDLQRAVGEADKETVDALAQALVRSNQFERALPVLIEVTSRMGASPDSTMLYYRGLAEYQSKKLDDAARSFDAAVKADPKNAISLFYLGRIAYERGEADAAIANLNRATTADPRLAQAWQLLTLAYLRRAAEAGDTPKANENYLNAVRTSDALVRLRADESAAVLSGQSLIGAKQYVRAATVLESAASNANAQGSTLYLLGVAYSRAKNFPKAISALERAAAKSPADVNVYRELGYAYEVSKLYAKALAAYQKGSQLAPDDTDFKDSIARVTPFAK